MSQTMTSERGQKTQAQTYKNYIGGRWVESKSGRTFTSTNPAHKDQVLGVLVLIGIVMGIVGGNFIGQAEYEDMLQRAEDYLQRKPNRRSPCDHPTKSVRRIALATLYAPRDRHKPDWNSR